MNASAMLKVGGIAMLAIGLGCWIGAHNGPGRDVNYVTLMLFGAVFLAAPRVHAWLWKEPTRRIETRAVLPGGVLDDGTPYHGLDARHTIVQHGDDVIVAESWHQPDGTEKRLHVRLSFAQLVHIALNTTEEERAAIDARADWRGVGKEER